MSRLIIKGLPKRLSEDELRKIFSFAGEVTDAKVIRNRAGASRQFGFVGFRREADASKARKQLNGTFVQSSRVVVEVARAAGDPNIPRPWSKHSKGSSAYEKRVQREEDEEVERRRAEARKLAKDVRAKKLRVEHEARNSKGIDEKDKEAFGAFKEAVGMTKKNPVWADGDVSGKEPSGKAAISAKLSSADTERLATSSDDEDDDDDEEYQELPEKVKEDDKLVANAVALDDGVSDADYFKSKISKAGLDEDNDESDGSSSDDSSSDDSSDDSSESEGSENNEKKLTPDKNTKKDLLERDDHPRARPEKLGENSKNKEVDAAETGRLFVRNLSFNVTEEDLEGLFEKYGVLAEVHLVTDSVSKQSRGVAFILYVVPENAPVAMAALDGTIFHGRLLHVLPGRPRPGDTKSVRAGPGTDAAGMNSFKREREEARAEAARSGADADAQNAMYLGADAVADTVAHRLGVSKGELYGTERGDSGGAAVRLAVAEATIQAETRQFLLQNGVDLRKASAGATEMNANTQHGRRKRMSRTAFLIKNLPARTKESDMHEIFSKFGTLNRLALAPSGLLAVVEYSTANEAKRAYAGQAYKRYQDVPLYLEWLPAEAVSRSEQRIARDDEAPSNPKEGANNAVQAEVDTPNGVLVNSSSVFVKNLNFDTREDSLKDHFKQLLKRRRDVLGGMRAVTVATKKNPNDPTGARLSMGFGFVEFASRTLAGEAVKLAQGSSLEGHTLELRLSNRTVDPQNLPDKKRGRSEKEKKRKPSPKLIVRNIAFEATAKDIRALFAEFGQIKSVRLPRKMDGSHRGFGFLEFISKNEANAAMTALSDAHLYGRHLVVEYADEDANGFASLEKLQEIAGKQMPKNKRRKVGDGETNAEEGVDEEELMRDEMYR